MESEFKCLYNGPDWLSWVSLIIVVIFVMVIILQSYLKYEFYAHETRASVLKKSQQGIPLLLIFHIVIEIIAITQTLLVLLLVMNAIAVTLIAHLMFMD